MNNLAFQYSQKMSPATLSARHLFGTLPIQTRCGLLDDNYLEKIRRTIEHAINEHPRTFAVRVDLRLPNLEYFIALDIDTPNPYSFNNTNVISRFIDSLKAHIKADLNRKARQEKRVHRCSPRIIWCKERDTSINEHFHLLVLLNKDTYHRLGCYGVTGSLASMLVDAWASALGCDYEDAQRLVHFPENSGYYVHRHHDEFEQEFCDVFYRTSYLAKINTKEYGNKERSFGCSLK
jgi:hypothetical protein